MSGAGDLFGKLPDELLYHVLSFLPSLEAVKSSLLSRRWRHLWRSTPAIRVGGKGDDFRLFVNSLIVHRKPVPLCSFDRNADLVIGAEDEKCIFYSMAFDSPYHQWRGKVDPHIDLWVTHALSSCRARSLTTRFKDELVPWRPWSPLTFASPHLTTVHLDAVHLVDRLLDFSCCSALRSLALLRCRLDGDALVSPSLEHLTLMDCHSDMDFDPEEPDDWLLIGISAPRLRFMEISKYYKQEQFLEMMPWLTEVNIQYTASKGFILGVNGDGTWKQPAQLLFN